MVYTQNCIWAFKSKCLYFTSILKDNFTRYRICGRKFFSLNYLNTISTTAFHHLYWEVIISSLKSKSFIWLLLRFFFFFWVSVVLLWFSLMWLLHIFLPGIHSISLIYGLMFFSSLGKLTTIISSNIASTPLFLSFSLSKTAITHLLDFLTTVYDSYILYFPFFFYILSWIVLLTYLPIYSFFFSYV